MMAYVESFARAMERARASVSYWDHKTLDHLQAAHDAEMRQCSKSEYHRGFEDSKATRDADQWQLDRERKAVVARLQVVNPSELCGSHEILSAICKAIFEPPMGWTIDAGEILRDHLVYLLGGENVKLPAEPNVESAKNGENHQTGGYDVLGNERQKVVCRLRGFEPRNGGKPTEEASKLIRCIIGREDCHVACGNDLEEARDRLIHLLGGECNFSGVESDIDAQDDGTNPAETSEGHSDRVSLGTQPVTGEQREYADDYCYRGHFSAFKSMAYPTAWGKPAETSEDANGTASNNDRTCPIAVQSPSITSELRKFAETFRYEWYDEKDGSVCYTTSNMPPTIDSVNGADYINGIADRIDAQFERICSQHESVLQQTISETIDEHECEMDELRADYEQAISDITGVERGEGSDLLMPVDVFLHVRDGLRHDVEMWRDRAEDMRMERDDLRAELRVAKHLHECNSKLARRNGQWCDALLDLIRDAAKDYQECQRLLRVFKCHAKDMRHERDDLLDKLQAISVLCEQDDG